MRILALLALLAAVPAPAGAESAHLAWDGCNSTTLDKEFTGPGLDSMTVTVGGSARTIQGYELVIDVMDPLAECQRGTFPPAWEFESGGCNDGRWSVAYTGAGCLSPGAPTGTIALYEAGPYAASRRIRIAASFSPPVTLEADKTYRLVTITFDHGASTVAGPDSCSGAGEPICLYMTTATWLDPQNNTGPWNDYAMAGLTWNQDANGFFSCPFLCDAAVPKTWGSLKAGYR